MDVGLVNAVGVEIADYLENGKPQDRLSNTIKKFSPKTIEIFDETIKAKNSGLKDKVRSGLLKTIEQLVWDFLINVRGEDKEKLSGLTVSEQLKIARGTNLIGSLAYLLGEISELSDEKLQRVVELQSLFAAVQYSMDTTKIY
jgi:hypothetical protein